MHIISFFLLPNSSNLYEPYINCSLFFFFGEGGGGCWQRACEDTRGDGDEKVFSTNVPETWTLVASEGQYKRANLCTLCSKVRSRCERALRHVGENRMILEDVYDFVFANNREHAEILFTGNVFHPPPHSHSPHTQTHTQQKALLIICGHLTSYCVASGLVNDYNYHFPVCIVFHLQCF